MLFLVVFAVGCGLGALLHVGIAAGPMALAQDRAADAIGNGIDRLKWQLGLAPDWRPEFHHRSREWPDLDRAQALPAPDEFAPSSKENDQWADEDPPSADHWDDEAEMSRDEGLDDSAFEDDASGEAEAAEVAEADADKTETGGLDMMRPAGLPEPRAGVPDNLQRIWGIGKRNEALLNSLGIYHFGQIASWTPAEARWVASRLTFPERLERDNWIGQAIVLATGGDPGAVSPSNHLKEPETDEE